MAKKEKEDPTPTCDQCGEPFILEPWGHNAYCSKCLRSAIQQTARMAAARRVAVASGANIVMTEDQKQRDIKALKAYPQP